LAVISEFYVRCLEFGKQIALPLPKVAEFVDVITAVLRGSKERIHPSEQSSEFQQALTASSFSVEEVQSITVFVSKQYFQYEHLYRYAFEHGQQDDSVTVAAPIELPMTMHPLSAGMPCPSPVVEWVEGGPVWEGLIQAMYTIDSAFAAKPTKRATDEGNRCCTRALRWGKLLREKLEDPDGPYNSTGVDTMGETVSCVSGEIAKLMAWLQGGATEDQADQSAEEEETPAEPADGEVAPPPVYARLQGGTCRSVCLP